MRMLTEFRRSKGVSYSSQNQKQYIWPFERKPDPRWCLVYYCFILNASMQLLGRAGTFALQQLPKCVFGILPREGKIPNFGPFLVKSKHLKGHLAPSVSDVTFLLTGHLGPRVIDLTFLLTGYLGLRVSDVTFLLTGHLGPASYPQRRSHLLRGNSQSVPNRQST